MPITSVATSGVPVRETTCVTSGNLSRCLLDLERGLERFGQAYARQAPCLYRNISFIEPGNKFASHEGHKNEAQEKDDGRGGGGGKRAAGRLPQ